MSEGEARILARLDPMDQKIADLDSKVTTGAQSLTKAILVISTMDSRLRRVETAINGGNGHDA